MFYLFKVCTEFITCCKSSKQKSWERQTWGCLHASQTLGSDNKLGWGGVQGQVEGSG